MADALDIATKLVSSDQVIWSVFPGTGKKFLDMFVSERAIFLDMPGIDLRPGVLQDEELLRKHVAMSVAIRDWYRRGGEGPTPSRRAATYAIPRNASFNAAVGNVRNVFVRMKPGDLVAVAGRSIYDPVLLGEVRNHFSPESTTTYRRYAREQIPTRPVRWLRVGQQRRYLSEELSHLLSNRKAVISIDQKKFGHEVYTAAYGDYVFGSDARYVFHGPHYNNIATSTTPGVNLISYFVAAFHAADIDELPKFANLNIDQAINSYFEQDVLHSFELDFHSPGEYVLYAKRAALPLLVAVLVFATGGDTVSSLQGARAVEITNSSSAHGPETADECTVEIQDKYRAIMNSINADRFNELCKLNKEAKDGVGLNVKIKPKPQKKAK